MYTYTFKNSEQYVYSYDPDNIEGKTQENIQDLAAKHQFLQLILQLFHVSLESI